MKFVEKIAKTVDDAVTEALIELGLTTNDVEIEVLEKGSKGFLGIGAKVAKVRVSVKQPKREVTKEIKQEIKKEVKKEVVDTTLVVQEEVTHVQEEQSLEEATNRGKVFLADILTKMGIEAEIEVSTDKNNNVNMVISGDKMGLIIGKRGEHLDALQYLVNLVVNKNMKQYTRVTLDTENYRKRREETLRKLAYRLAKKASQTKQKVALEPMNPYDRRIIHSALQDNRFVKTYSEGKEPYRKVVITPAGYKEYNHKE